MYGADEACLIGERESCWKREREIVGLEREIVVEGRGWKREKKRVCV